MMNKYSIDQLKTMASIAVRSGKYVGYDESTILNIYFSAIGLGIEPTLALNSGFNIIKGKLNMGAPFMLALIRRAGHSVQCLEMTATKCIVKGTRKDNGDSMTYEMTLAEAEAAGNAGKTTWKSNPKQMLYWDCIRNLYRMLFSDLGIAYDADEMNVDSPAQQHEVVGLSSGPIEMVPDTRNLETLKANIEKVGLPVEELENCLEESASRKGKPVEQVIVEAQEPHLIEKFQKFYAEYLDKKAG